MAKDKKSFMLYIDQMGIFDKLEDDQAGRLIKHIFMYCNDENPKADFITELAFESIKQSLKRDLKKYENICNRNSINGSKGGRPKKPSGLLGNPKKTKKADSDSDSDSDSDILFKERKEKFILWFNQQRKVKTGKLGKVKMLSKTDTNNLKQLLKDYTIEEFQIAFNNMHLSPWAVENKQCNTSHFLRVENFNKYLNEGDKTTKKVDNLYD